MQFLLHLHFICLFVYFANGVILKTSMTNEYPQVAVLGCDSRKANLYYDTEKQVWVEHLISSCINNEQGILEFCQQAYPSLRIGNIVRSDTVLRFENWCELVLPIDKNGDNIHRCKQDVVGEEVIQPFRCLSMNNKQEQVALPTSDCSIHSLTGTGECLRAKRWQQLASIECANKSMALNNSIMTSDWCGLSEFRGIEFVCCPLKQPDENDYETSPDEQDDKLNEDDAVQDSSSIPSRRIISMTLAIREPSWMEDYRRWDADPAYFADDEDTNDYQPSPVPKSNEQERFDKEKDKFKEKYKIQIDQLKSRWQKRQTEIQLLASRNETEARRQYEKNEVDFRQEYDIIKQSASRERTRINELHEIHLDTALNIAKTEANNKLIAAWNEKPLKTENVSEALNNYLQILLRDRIHLVNRYERLRAVDPEQFERKRVTICERLRLISDRMNDALSQLRSFPNLQTKIRPRLDTLFFEYDEVNQAANKLVNNYAASSTTTSSTKKPINLLLGRDEKKIYPFGKSSTTNSYDSNNEYDYATNDEYDEDDDDDDKIEKTSTVQSTTTESDMVNYDQIETGNSDWDVNSDDDESTFEIKIDDDDQQAFVNENSVNTLAPPKRISRVLFVTYLPYVFGCLLIVCLMIGIFVIRFVRQNRSDQNRYEKTYAFTDVECCTPDDKSLHKLQMNGYENPTYKFFEGQQGKC